MMTILLNIHLIQTLLLSHKKIKKELSLIIQAVLQILVMVYWKNSLISRKKYLT